MMRCPRAEQQPCRPSLRTWAQARRAPRELLTQAGDPPLGVRPPALTCVRIFTVLSRLPGRQSLGGW